MNNTTTNHSEAGAKLALFLSANPSANFSICDGEVHHKGAADCISGRTLVADFGTDDGAHMRAMRAVWAARGVAVS